MVQVLALAALLLAPSIAAVQTAKLTASDGAAGDMFGVSVAFGSGQSHVIVGAPSDDDKGTNSGSAYVFDLNGNFLKKLTASDGAAGDMFGTSVSIDGSRMVVGAAFDDDKGTNSGSAYVFDLNGNFLTKLTASDGAAGDMFGFSVSISTAGSIVVGAPFDDDKGTNSGSAYVFSFTGVVPDTKVTANDGAAGDAFGFSVITASGFTIIGAPFDDDKGTNSGSAYVFNFLNVQTAKLTANDGRAGDGFGTSVSFTGHAVVGAPFDDDKGSNSGSVYHISLSGVQVAKFTPSDGAAGDSFGLSVSASSGNLIIGSPFDDDKGSNSGSAYVFDFVTGAQRSKLTASDGASGDSFGLSVSTISGMAAVGAPFDDDKGSNSGSAYEFQIGVPGV